MYKVGLGQDSHPFDNHNDKPLILGGVKIADHGGLQANSDGDVILHSLCNALSSAIGGDSLGTWADELCLKHKVSDSKEYIGHIFNKVNKIGYRVENISISIEAKKPYLSSNTVKKIKGQLMRFLEIKMNQIGITFTSGEGLTPFGQGQGIQALSIVLIKKK